MLKYFRPSSNGIGGAIGMLLVAVLTVPSLSSVPFVDALDAVNLGTAGDFVILSKTGVTTTGTTSVNGDMGVSPITSTAITGFTLILDSSTTYSTSDIVSGKVYAASYTSPTPSKMTTAVSDMETAFTTAAGLTSTDKIDDLGAGSIQGETLNAGLYKWGTSVGFTSAVTFHGSKTDIWVLQIAQNLIVGDGARVTLTGGALPQNIFWQVSGKTILGTTSHIEGVILCKTQIVFKTGSSMIGAALSQTAVTLDAATIVKY